MYSFEAIEPFLVHLEILSLMNNNYILTVSGEYVSRKLKCILLDKLVGCQFKAYGSVT